jgi:acyl-ACP thioesterase
VLKHPFGKYNFIVKSYDSDQKGKLTLPALFHFLQECAWDNARLNDFGFEFLKRKNAFWVLSRIFVKMDEYPEWKDEIEIKTWPKGADGFFAFRDFEVYSKGRIIGRVTSSWLIIDRNTKRPRKPESFNFIHDNFISEHAIKRKLDKINFNGETEELELRKVYYSDLDVNKHVNNATYVRWILDSFFSNESKSKITEFEINFLLELSLSDEFTIHTINDEKETYFVLKNTKGREVCKAKIRY